MTKTLYVGNLPWSINEGDLTAAFEAHGQVVSARIVTEKGSGRSRGFGFVEVEDLEAEKMVKAMNGFQMGGRPVIVNEARPKQAGEEPQRERRE